uniref:Uncharacterized protein n=1 Tax=Bubo bubo TaxID=30461 RepID=A0A8C0IHE0_BUBBB
CCLGGAGASPARLALKHLLHLLPPSPKKPALQQHVAPFQQAACRSEPRPSADHPYGCRSLGAVLQQKKAFSGLRLDTEAERPCHRGGMSAVRAGTVCGPLSITH